jgi:hypothetical protein
MAINQSQKQTWKNWKNLEEVKKRNESLIETARKKDRLAKDYSGMILRNGKWLFQNEGPTTTTNCEIKTFQKIANALKKVGEK